MWRTVRNSEKLLVNNRLQINIELVDFQTFLKLTNPVNNSLKNASKAKKSWHAIRYVEIANGELFRKGGKS